MSDLLQRITRLSPKRLALLALDLQQRLDAAERGAVEPVAVIGLGCRFPGGATGPDGYWSLLREGRDAIREVPRDRWDVDAWYDPDPDVPGKMATRWGGFLDEIDRFDPGFFGISPREAASMDPQQRLLLEVAWEALEHAGQAPDRLGETRTGVFVGICGNDYFNLLMRSAAGPSNTYLASGTAHSVVSGRLSYVLGLRGPSVSIDTACSSSLAAVHLACQSLRVGDCRMALAGGVNAVLLPEPTVALSVARMMAPDGRCKAFDASANGFVRAEGCGVVVLKRLADARADGDRVIAVIAGSAINQDGRSSGLTAPNGPSQEAVILQAVAQAGIVPADVSYVEAHGTGTALGDPIEARALAAALGQGRPADRPLTVGSVKTNFGHTEAASGIAGLIKVVLSLEHGFIPPHLHLRTLSPQIPWRDLPLRVSSSGLPWPAGERRFAGVSSLGFSGTNVHVIVADPPAAAPDDEWRVDRPLHVCCLSAKSASALRCEVARLADRLRAAPELAVADVAFTADAGRAHFAHRIAVAAGTRQELEGELADVLGGEPSPRTKSGVLDTTDEPEVVFLFTGQGAQYPGMAAGLYATQPIFRDALDRCAAALEGQMDAPLLAVLHGSETSRLNSTAYTQPAVFALEYAIAELWRAWGVTPAFVVGHSLGEYAAACVAGVMSVEDALGLVAARGRLTGGLPPGGAMAAVEADAAQVERALRPYGNQVVIAAVNGPSGHVISGHAAAVEAVCAAIASTGARTQLLAVSHAFHSPLLEPALDAFEAAAARVRFSAPQIGYVSNVTGRLAGADEVANARYWRRHAREAVQFAAGMQTLWAQGCRVFVEIGPSATLLGMARLCVPDLPEVAWLPSLRKGRPDWDQLLETVSELHVRGVKIDWAGFDRPYRRRVVALPTYPFERQRYWIEDAERARRSTAPALVEPSSDAHPLLSRRTASARGEMLFETSVGVHRLPFLGDHRVHGLLVLPGPVYLEMALAAAADALGTNRPVVEEAAIHEPLHVPEAGDGNGHAMQIIVSPRADDGASFEIFGEDGEAPHGWRLHASGHVRTGWVEPGGVDLDEARGRCMEEMAGREYYDQLRAVGIDFGPAFRGIERLWRRDGEAVGRIAVPPGLATSAYRLHPAVLDACLQVAGAGLPGSGDQAGLAPTYLMVGLGRYVCSRPVPTSFWVHARLHGTEHPGEMLTGDVALVDDEGGPLASLSGLRLKRARHDALVRRTGSDQWLYELRWQPIETAVRPRADRDSTVTGVGARRPEASPGGDWLLVGNGDGLADALDAHLSLLGAGVLRVDRGGRFAVAGDRRYALDPACAADFDRLMALIGRRTRPVTNVVHLMAVDASAGEPASADALDGDVSAGLRSGLHLVQALVRAALPAKPRLWIVTRESQSVEEEAPARGLSLGQAAVWGFGRTVAVEHPEFWGGLVDVDAGEPSATAAALVARIGSAESGEDQMALRQGRWYVPRLARMPRRAASGSIAIRPDATYLVTGGTGGIGTKVARWLIDRGARHLVLTGRTGARRLSVEERQRLADSDADVRVKEADSGSPADIAKVLAEIDRDMPPLRGVIHIAGTFDDRVLARQDWERFQGVLAPKVRGGFVLHQLTREMPLDFFVLFSSGASFLAPVGLGNYASGNAFLDALAHHRRRLGLPALSIDWGPWQKVGMAEAVGERRESQWTQAGFATMPPVEALDALERLLAGAPPPPQIAVLAVDWSKYVERFGPDCPALYGELVRGGAHRSPSAATGTSAVPALLRTLGGASPAEWPQRLIEHVETHVADVLGFRRGFAIDPDQQLFELGMDSLTAVELKNRLQLSLGRSLSSTLVFEHPSVRALAGYLAPLLAMPSPAGGEPPIPAQPVVDEDGLAPEEAGEMLTHLSDLSDEEVAALLARMTPEDRR